ncbi:uncharacterized protein LOC116218469 [Clupea harengus]|uniref:Uncharacterized protein LOC116218469 n=1 Tax=Clupea harengus TaxID=7950 RepID=A0A8M1KAM4_CLUHA|nr:uncharacterized protein LOC116218469 [Clupea harengus]
MFDIDSTHSYSKVRLVGKYYLILIGGPYVTPQPTYLPNLKFAFIFADSRLPDLTMTEGNESKKKSFKESRAECSSTTRTKRFDADLDHMNLSPMIRHLVENMTEEHWIIVREALCVPRSKEEVGHLCGIIVKKVVQTAHYYLLPVLSEILGVPVSHVCGMTRVSTSEARRPEGSSLRQGSQGITNEMLLAAAKKEVDEILQESVRIVSGLDPVVPALPEGYSSISKKNVDLTASCIIKDSDSGPTTAPMMAEDAKASRLSQSIPLLNQFTGTEFQQRVSKQVSEVLLKTLENESPVKEFAEDDEESNSKAVSQTDLCQVHAIFPSGPLSESLAVDLVDDIIESMKDKMSGQEVHSTSYDVVGFVIEGMKDLLEKTRALGTVVPMKRIYRTTSQRMFNAIQNMVGKLFCKSFHSDSKKEITVASAINVTSQVIVSMQSELPDLKTAENLKQVELIDKILSAMLNEVQVMDIGTETDRSPSPGLPLSHSSVSFHSEIDDQTKLPGTSVPPEVFIERISPLLTHTFVDMDAASLSPGCANETISSVLDTILEWEKRVPITGRLEKLITETQIGQYSCDIADRVHKTLKGYHGLQTISVPVGKSLSDSVLCKLTSRAEGKNNIPSGFVYSYVEEAVKRLLLSCLFPSASSENQELLQNNLETSKSSPDVFGSTMNVFTQMMTNEVMVALSTELKENYACDLKELLKEDQKLLNQQAQDTKTRSSTTNSNNLPPRTFDEHKDLMQNSQCEGVTISCHLRMLESDKNDYASLVSMLVIRLLKKVNSLHQDIGTNQDGLPDNVLDMSRDLIQKILSELDTTFDITDDESYPQDLNCHQIYRSVYKELTRKYGSEDVLRSALESHDPSFESSLVEMLTKELTKTCSQTSIPASAHLPPIQAAVGQDQGKEKTKKKMFPVWLKMPTIKSKVEYHAYHLAIGVLYCHTAILSIHYKMYSTQL